MQSLKLPWPLNPSTGEARANVLSGGVHGFGMLPSLNTAALAAVIATELTQGAAICHFITLKWILQRLLMEKKKECFVPAFGCHWKGGGQTDHWRHALDDAGGVGRQHLSVSIREEGHLGEYMFLDFPDSSSCQTR